MCEGENYMNCKSWLAKAPLVLASGSATRRKLLEAAGIPVCAQPADIDERATDRGARASGADAAVVAALLARAKAMNVSLRFPGRLVLGADQTLACDGKQFDKPQTISDAAAHLAAFSGRSHQLHSAAALVIDGLVLAEIRSSAELTVRCLSAQFIHTYLEDAGPSVLGSVGGYQLEGIGVQLFDKIQGDHFTILGLPLLPLMAELRAAGYLAE